MGLLWSFMRSSSKIMATFIVMLLLTFIMILFVPGAYVGLQDFAEWIDDGVRNPPMESTNVAIYRFFVNSSTIMGVIMTIISRAIVDLGAMGFGGLFKGFQAEAEVDAAESAAGIKDPGYSEG